MSQSLLLPTACCLLVLSAPLSAQNPFGGSPSGADPFGGGSSVKDPFGGSPTGADPFGGGSSVTDPFAQAAKQGRNGNAKNRQPRSNPATKSRTAPRGGSAEDRLRAALNEQTTATFVNLPLMDALQQLGENHDIPIVVDRRALEEVGLSGEEPVTLSLKNVSLRSFLRLCLRDLDLTYVIDDEVLQITTTEAAERHLILETYLFPGGLIDKSEQVITALTATVTPTQWEMSGGSSTVAAVDNVLVVSGSQSVHEGVVDFLHKLDDAYQRHLAKQKTATPRQP